MHGGFDYNRTRDQYMALRGWFHAACYEIVRLRDKVERLRLQLRARDRKILEHEAEIARLCALLLDRGHHSEPPLK